MNGESYAKATQIQLNCIDRMINRYPKISIGYSGHVNPENMIITQMAIAKGATILERHIGHATEEIHNANLKGMIVCVKKTGTLHL